MMDSNAQSRAIWARFIEHQKKLMQGNNYGFCEGLIGIGGVFIDAKDKLSNEEYALFVLSAYQRMMELRRDANPNG